LKRGDYVRTRTGLKGRIVWDGEVPGKGNVMGIELEEWSENGNDGSHNGHHYFRSPPGRGYFAYARNLSAAKPPPKKATNDGGISVGDQVTLRNGKEGTVMFVGTVGSSEVVGIKLRFWSESGHDGKGYFKCPQGYGYFAKINTIVSATKKGGGSVKLDQKKKAPPPDEPAYAPSPVLVDCEEGDKVRLQRGRVGIVKWTGTLNGKKLIGLELDAWSEKGNDGTLKGTKYFSCQPGRGYFADYSKVSEVLQRAPKKASKPKPIEPEPPIEEEDDDPTTLRIALGDKVELRKGRVGFVRYIGNVKGLRGEVVGLELLSWFDRGHNGTSADGTKYYQCKDGTGYWTSRVAVARVLEKSGNKAVPTAKKKKKAEPVQKKQELPEVTVDFNMGDTVRLRKGREGVVKYYNPRNGILGMELLSWSADASDGTHKGKEYFKCDPGRGYFTTHKAVKEVLKRAPRNPDAKKQQQKPKKKEEPPPLDDAAVEFKIGDRVRLHRGRVGTVRFIGKTNFSTSTVVGIELERWSEKGNDGTAGGTRYFTTRGPGWGYFTKPSAVAEVIVMP